MNRFLCLVAAALILLMCTCGLAQQKDAPAQPGRKMTIGVVTYQTDQFFRMLELGISDAAKKAGVELLISNNMSKPETESQIVDSCIARKVDALVMAPVSSKSSSACINRATKAGIKVVLTNSPVDNTTPASVVEADQVELGALGGSAARKFIQEKMGGKAKVAILAFKAVLPEQSNARTNGFKQEIAKLPGVEIVTEQDAWLTEMSIKKASDIMTAHPDVDVFWSANEGGTVGAALAVASAHKTGKVFVFGSAVSKQLLDLLDSPDNIVQALATQKPFEMGQLGLEQAVKALKNEKVDSHIVMKNLLIQRGDKPAIQASRKQLDQIIESAK